MWLMILLYLWSYNSLLGILANIVKKIKLGQKIRESKIFEFYFQSKFIEIRLFEEFLVGKKAFENNEQNKAFENNPNEISQYFQIILGEIEFKFVQKQIKVKRKIWILLIIFNLVFIFITYFSQILSQHQLK